MATVINKDFKIKNGLVVEGTTATVNGNNILLEGASDSYIIGLIGGSATSNATPNSVVLRDGSANFSVHGITFDDDASTSSIYAGGNDLTVYAHNNLYLNTNNSDIILQPDGQAKIWGDVIATETFVTNQGYITLSEVPANYITSVNTNGALLSVDNGVLSFLPYNLVNGSSSGISVQEDKGTYALTLNYTQLESQLVTDGFAKTVDIPAAYITSVNTSQFGVYNGLLELNASVNVPATATIGGLFAEYNGTLDVQNDNGTSILKVDSSFDINNDMYHGYNNYTHNSGLITLNGMVGITSENNPTTGFLFMNVGGASTNPTLHLESMGDLALRAGADGNDGNIILYTGSTSSGQNGKVYIGWNHDSGSSAGNQVATFDDVDSRSVSAVANALNLTGGLVYDGGTGFAVDTNLIATKAYADSIVQGLDVKQSVRLATTGPITLSGESTWIDGQQPISLDRVLVKDQVDVNENGIYIVNKSGSWSKAADDPGVNGIGTFTFVEQGINAGHGFVQLAGNTWTQFSDTGAFITGIASHSALDVTANVLSLVLDSDSLTQSSSGLAVNLNSGGYLGNDSGLYVDRNALATDLAGTGITAENGQLTAAPAYITSVGSNLSVSNGQLTVDLTSKLDNTDPTVTGSLTLDGTGDFTITADSNIVLVPSTTAYLNSATSGNEIATKSYVDTAVGNVTIDLSTAAGANIDWNSGTNQFDVNVTDVITNGGIATTSYVSTNYVASADLDTSVSGLGYAKTVDLPIQYTDQDAIDAINGATITPHAVTINTYRKEEATQQYVQNASTVNVHTLTNGYESVKYLVRVVGWNGGVKHSQLTEILVTVDGNNNIAMTEYGTVCTDSSNLASFSAIYSGGQYTLTATTVVGGCEIIAAATMLSWAD